MLYRVPLDHPSLEALSYLLRHKEYWPAGFEWEFQSYGSCALGLADKFWHNFGYEVDGMFADIPYTTYQKIFIHSDTKPPVKVFWLFRRERYHEEVTPEMVADQIDDYLRRIEEYATHAQHGKNSREDAMSRVPA
jgi:hypothetical protein